MEKLIVLVFVSCLISSIAGSWVPIKFSVTSDNAYAVYSGSGSALKYLGSDYNEDDNQIFNKIEHYPAGPFGKHDPTPAKKPLYMDPSHSIYIVAWSDAQDHQGVLVDMVINGVQISSKNPLWKVFPTKFFPQPSGLGMPTASCSSPSAEIPFDRDMKFGQSFQAPPCPEWIQKMIEQADSGGLWAIPTLGEVNLASANSIYQKTVTGIPAINQWMWYNSSDFCAPSLQRPFDVATNDRCHHGEPLIFKISSQAWSADPTACQPAYNNVTNTKFCTGQCPFRADGSQPNCASIFTATGSLRNCECCQPCDVVVMPNVVDNYCSGYCPNCLQCEPTAWAEVPNDPHHLYIKACGCTPPNYDGPCKVDRCSNRCVGTCPESDIPCIPTSISSSGQIEKCDCVDDKACRLVDQANGQLVCSGVCKNPETPCKGFYYNGALKACTCDCCELVRKEDQRLNYCMGKCDNANLRCDAAQYGPWVAPDGHTYDVIIGCGCKV